MQIFDLLETEYNNYLTTGSPKESLFVLRLEHHQQHGIDDKASPEIPELHYELYAVKIPALYNFCENQMKRLIVLSAFWNGHPTEEPAAPWGADRAYRLVMDDGFEHQLYLLCYENILLEIEFSWQPTAGQMRTVGENIVSFSSVS